MKKIATIVALMAVAVSAFAQSGKDIYNKYSSSEGVEAVYISQAMFRMVQKLPDKALVEEDIDFGPLLKSLTGLYILNMEDGGKAAKDLAAEEQAFVKSSKYELMMEVKEDGEAVHIYTSGDEDTVTSFVMFVRDGEETTFIAFDGDLSREEIEKFIASAIASD